MKAYYEDKWVTIYHGDCREFSGQKVDLILTDPPYGIDENYASIRDSKGNLAVLIDESYSLIRRKCDVALISVGVANIQRWPRADWVLAWVTPAGSGSGPWGFCCWQPILAYGKDPYLARGLGRRHDYFNHTESSEINGHPCPKPLGIWKKILIRGSPSLTDVILDPFMGSGTTLRAAKDLGRKAIGIEIEERYCEIAAKRMEQEVFDFASSLIPLQTPDIDPLLI